jgi:hypothetical protein
VILELVGLDGAGLALLSVSVGVAACWWAVKKLAVVLDRPRLWDQADLAVGVLGGFAWAAVYLAAPPLDQAVIHPAAVALRRGATGIYVFSVGFWFASVGLEATGRAELPQGLQPIRYRFYEQMSWVPFFERLAPDITDYCPACRSEELEAVGLASGDDLGQLCLDCGRIAP